MNDGTLVASHLSPAAVVGRFIEVDGIGDSMDDEGSVFAYVLASQKGLCRRLTRFLFF